MLNRSRTNKGGGHPMPKEKGPRDTFEVLHRNTSEMLRAASAIYEKLNNNDKTLEEEEDIKLKLSHAIKVIDKEFEKQS
jgi:hypothetical protein